MDEKNIEYYFEPDDPGFAAFEGKVKEKLYELQLKRNTLSETRKKVHEGLLERHNLERSLEKVTRELEEVKIQLDVAIKAARRSESERANSREYLARQSVQLEGTLKDRNLLQDEIRKLQVENGDLQRQLEQVEEKLKSHLHLQETCKIKENQWRTYFETLQSQIKALEQDQGKLKEINNTSIEISMKALFQLTHERNTNKEITMEKNRLFDQVLSQKSELECLKREANNKDTVLEQGYKKSYYLEEWENAQREMELKMKENGQEIEHLQNSLSKALTTMRQLQKSEIAKDDRIKHLEIQLENINNSNNHSMIDVSQQCEDVNLIP